MITRRRFHEIAALGAGAQVWRASDSRKARLMQGPMLGAVTPSSALIWARASHACHVQVEHAACADFDASVMSETVTARADDDYAVTIRLAGLVPGEPRYYRMRFDGELDDAVLEARPLLFRTPSVEPHGFRLAFGSCAKYAEDPNQPIWRAVRASEPDLFFWLGDNVYMNARNDRSLRDEYQRQRDVADYQPVARSIPNLAIWDDHDYGSNNQDRTNPTKVEALAEFRRYWANPAYGTPEIDGVFFRYAYGGVDFFFLDGRYNRDPNHAPDRLGKTMLGIAQGGWLRRELKQSAAPFKVLVSGGGWSKAKGKRGDSWAAFLHERDALFDFVRDEGISGVVLLSGDTHVAELNAIPWSQRGGYDFYELTSSPLAQNARRRWLRRKPELRVRPVFSAGPNFGMLSFSFVPKPTLVYNVIDVHGRPVWEPLRIGCDELVNGIASAESKTVLG